MRSLPLTPSVSTLYADALGAFLSEQGLPQDARSPGPRLCGVSYSTLMAGASRELGDQGLGLRFGARGRGRLRHARHRRRHRALAARSDPPPDPARIDHQHARLRHRAPPRQPGAPELAAGAKRPGYRGRGHPHRLGFVRPLPAGRAGRRGPGLAAPPCGWRPWPSTTPCSSARCASRLAATA
ncbi:hypothetical protein LP419_10400 [Massilia sp. H-1]|nr:hypothetical protein LP419_10400 [Massilia sp. H-1]